MVLLSAQFLPVDSWTAGAIHIPDGVLAVLILLLGWAIAVPFVTIAARRSQRAFSSRTGPLLGIAAAFVFAAQAVNFPIAAGSSGHLVLAPLVAIVLGPWSAVIVVATVLGAQALLLQDGGLLAMGANIGNLAVAAVFVASGSHRLLLRIKPASERWFALSAGLAAWLAVVVAALLTALELSISGVVPIRLSVGLLGGSHLLIGLLEGGITSAAVYAARRIRPDLFGGDGAPDRGLGIVATAGLLIVALGLAGLGAFSSELPDSLQRTLGLGSAGRLNLLPGNLVDLLQGQSGNGSWAGAMAFIIGALFVVAAVALLHSFGRKRSAENEA